MKQPSNILFWEEDDVHTFLCGLGFKGYEAQIKGELLHMAASAWVALSVYWHKSRCWILGLNRLMLTLSLYCTPSQNIKSMERYWYSAIMKLWKTSAFTQSYVRINSAVTSSQRLISSMDICRVIDWLSWKLSISSNYNMTYPLKKVIGYHLVCCLP